MKVSCKDRVIGLCLGLEFGLRLMPRFRVWVEAYAWVEGYAWVWGVG